MSILNPVLYGNRLYAQTLYSANPDIQTFNLIFNETISEADAIGNDTTKPLMDALSLLDSYITQLTLVKSDSVTLSDTFIISAGEAFADAIMSADSITKKATLSKSELLTLTDTLTRSITKILSDTVATSDSKAFEVSKVFSEFINLMDPNVILTITKAINDIVLVQDWISIRLMKPSIWSVAQKPLVGYSSLYGRALYGINLYSGLSATVWVSIKPTVPNNGWTNFNELRNI